MHRIDTATAQVDKFGPGKNGFTNGNPATGRRATDLNSDMWDAVQEEICGVVEGANITLQKGNNTQLLEAIKNIIITTNYPIGVVCWFAQNKNPNDIFPGTTWKYIGENRTVRLASETGSDVLATGGSDTATITIGNLPVHSHTFSANTSTFDYGTKTTSSGGEHQHTVASSADVGQGAVGVNSVQMSAGQMLTSIAGGHARTVSIGAHSHSISGTTSNTGSSSALTVTNAYVKLMGWYRTA